tara:strand:- start:1753 stop:2385 length:633 start_codon:yes stop_codon:yes gene_type:complete
MKHKTYETILNDFNRFLNGEQDDENNEDDEEYNAMRRIAKVTSSDDDDDDDEEIEEAALCHNKNTGHFDDCTSDNVYSLSKRGAQAQNIDDKFVARGTISSKTKGNPPKVKAKFGLNTSTKGKQGGRMKMPSGEKKSPSHSVSKYPKKYQRENKIVSPNNDAYIAGVVRREVERLFKQMKATGKYDNDKCSYRQLLTFMRDIELAQNPEK